MNGPNKLDCYTLQRLAKDKHSSLLGTFLSYEENNCFLFFLIYEWAQ
jgi:hypothetical protein